MAMNQLQAELLQLLSLGKKKQDVIIKEIDKFVNEHGLRNVKKWRNLANKKNTLLHELVEQEMPDVIHHIVLGEHKFDINIPRDSDGFTPLQLALHYHDQKMCDVLKDLGAHEIHSVDVPKMLPDEDKEKAMNIVWLDLEMTSFDDPEILECAVIVTDKDLNKLTSKNWVIHYEKKVLDKLADWHQKTFADTDNGGNGLFADVLKSKLTNDQVEEDLLDLLKVHCVEKRCPLGGSSVHIDKEVLKLRMRKVHDFLHYRVIDVSSFQGIMRRWAPWMETHIKKELERNGQETVNHRAMDDIEWSIAFMKEFRPLLPKQHNNAHNRKNEPPANNRPKRNASPPANNRPKRNVSPPAAARNYPFQKNNHVANDRVPLYADEKRLIERIKLDKNFDVKKLALDNKDQQMYDANPHLREVFMNNQQLTVYLKNFTIENRRLKLSSKPYDNNNRSNAERHSTTEHWGQRKLLLVEIEFLTTYAAIDKYLVIYAGAAPGSHIKYLSSLFPQLDFCLIDSNEFAIKPTKEIIIRAENFTDDLAKRYAKQSRNILFICNVRTFSQRGPNDDDLLKDMMDQMEWHRIMEPRASLLNFRLPRVPTKIKYLKGDLVIEPWASTRSTECRLIVDREHKVIQHDLVEIENALLHFHNNKRIRYYEYDMDDLNREGLDHCYDCRAEIFILQEYLTKTQRIKNSTDLNDRTAQMSSEISKEIADKRKELFMGELRTLKVIQKK